MPIFGYMNQCHCQCKKTNQLKVKEMKQEEFSSTKMLESSINIKKKINNTGGKVIWLNIKWFK